MAVLVALVSIPLLLIDGGSSADGETAATATPPPAEVTSTFAPTDVGPVADAVPQPLPRLVRRAKAWQRSRRAEIMRKTDRAIDLAGLAATATTDAPPDDATDAAPSTTEQAAPAPTTAPPVTAPPVTAPPTTAPPVTAPPTTTAPPPTTTTAPPPPDPSGEPTPAQWAALRDCESGGDYTAVSASGIYRGAYQFSQDTWDWVAGMTHGRLIGVDPAAAAPSDQDALAFGLWRVRGSSPWPSCGYLLD